MNINSKKIKDFNVRFESLKLIQDRIVKTFQYKCIGNNFLNRIPRLLNQEKELTNRIASN
jgi:hypothetical protein